MLAYETIKTVTKDANDQVFAIDFPGRPLLSCLSITETSGANITPTAELFSKDPTTLTANTELSYKIVPTLTLVAGKVMTMYEGVVPIMNHDDADARGVRPGKVYIRINGNSTGTFALRVNGYADLV